MGMKPSPARIGLFALAFAAFGCDEEQPKNKLVIESPASPLSLHVGDTSDVIKTSRTTIDAQGRENTESNYGYFSLASSDTNVAVIVQSTRVLARAPGEAIVGAGDDKSNLVSENKLTVTVAPAATN
jgi:hypothetical protein